MAAEKPQCASLTKRGRRCKNEAYPGRLFCLQHDPDLPTSPKAAPEEPVRGHPGIFKKGDGYVIRFQGHRLERLDTAATLEEAKSRLALCRQFEDDQARTRKRFKEGR